MLAHYYRGCSSSGDEDSTFEKTLTHALRRRIPLDTIIIGYIMHKPIFHFPRYCLFKENIWYSNNIKWTLFGEISQRIVKIY